MSEPLVKAVTEKLATALTAAEKQTSESTASQGHLTQTIAVGRVKGAAFGVLIAAMVCVIPNVPQALLYLLISFLVLISREAGGWLARRGVRNSDEFSIEKVEMLKGVLLALGVHEEWVPLVARELTLRARRATWLDNVNWILRILPPEVYYAPPHKSGGPHPGGLRALQHDNLSYLGGERIESVPQLPSSTDHRGEETTLHRRPESVERDPPSTEDPPSSAPDSALKARVGD